MIAEWDAKPDSLTLKIQPAIKFHDGVAWDARAAKWNLDRLTFHPAPACGPTCVASTCPRMTRPLLVELLRASPLHEVIVTDTVPLPAEAAKESRVRQVSVASLFAEAIRSIIEETSISRLFE